MKNRVVNLLLVCALVVSMVLPAAPVFATETAENVTAVETTAPAEQERMKASSDCIDMIKGYEGFSKKPYWDYAQWTVGYGTRCPSDKLEYYKANGISYEEAETLLRNYVGGVERYIYTHLIDKYDLNMTQQQFDALVSFSYNVGSGWMVDSSSTFRAMVLAGTTDPNTVIDKFSRWCNAGGSILNALVRRRLCEANVYLYGEYTRVPPENICYVKYNGNGGTISDKLQGYNGDLTATPVGTATRSGYTFDGWYTMAVGGTKVEALDKSVNTLTLYAHWSSGGESSVEQPENPVSVNVTGNGVNLRQGPGTNYSIMGEANKGDKLVITAVDSGSGLVWGQSEKGWICLKYTDYEERINDPEAPEETTPEETTPEETTPEETEPEETTPEETQPETPATVSGTVKANGGLNVRSGPGTGYETVATLSNGAKVEILEQKTVGAMTWGRIDKGWISMDYVVLTQTEDKPVEDQQKPEEKPEEKPVEKPVEQPKKITGTVKVSSTLNVRSGPGTSYDKVATLSNGAKVEILEQKTVGSTTWGRTEKGWISMGYVVLDEEVTQKPEDTTPPAQTPPEEDNTTPDDTDTEQTPDQDKPVSGTGVTGTVKVGDVLRIRKSAPAGDVVGYYANGTKVTVLETTTVGSALWGRTDRGWISMEYVKLDVSASQPVTKTVTADCLRVRSSAPSGNIVSYYYAGAKIQIVETTTVNGTLWGRTDRGWVSMEYVK